MKLDTASASIVIICPRCSWRGMAFTRDRAWAEARAHEIAAHQLTQDTAAARSARR